MSSTEMETGTKHVLQDSITTIIEGSASYYSLLKSYASGIPLASSSLERLEDVVKLHSPYAIEMYNTYGAPIISHMDDTYITPTVEQIPVLRAQAVERIDTVKEDISKNIQHIQEQITTNADQIKRPLQSLLTSPSVSIDWDSLSHQLEEGQHWFMEHARAIYNELYIVEVIKQRAKDADIPIGSIKVPFDAFHHAITKYANSGKSYASHLSSQLKTQYSGVISTIEGMLDHLVVGSKEASSALFNYLQKEFNSFSTMVTSTSQSISSSIHPQDKQKVAVTNDSGSKHPQSTGASPFSFLDLQSYSISLDLLDSIGPRLPRFIQEHPSFQTLVGQLQDISGRARAYLPASVIAYQDLVFPQQMPTYDDLEDLNEAFGYVPYTFQHDYDTTSSCSIPQVTQSFVLTQDLSLSPSSPLPTTEEDFTTPIAATSTPTPDHDQQVEDSSSVHSQPTDDAVDDESDSNSFSDHVVSATDPGNDDITQHNQSTRSHNYAPKPHRKRRNR